MTPTGTPIEGMIKLAGAPPIRINAVHPQPPISQAAEPEWRAAIEALPSGDGRILAGDFNATTTIRSCARCSIAATSTPPTPQAPG